MFVIAFDGCTGIGIQLTEACDQDGSECEVASDHGDSVEGSWRCQSSCRDSVCIVGEEAEKCTFGDLWNAHTGCERFDLEGLHRKKMCESWLCAKRLVVNSAYLISFHVW